MTLIQVAKAVLPVPEWGWSLGVIRAHHAGRSWWSVRYTDGTIRSEWDDDPGSPNGHADWPRLPYRGRQAVRLYCPNGQVATLGSDTDATGRLVQFKVGLRTAGEGQGVLAHVIGIVEGTDGHGTFYAWQRRPDGSGELVGPWTDNINDLKFENVGKLSTDHLGLAEA